MSDLFLRMKSKDGHLDTSATHLLKIQKDKWKTFLAILICVTVPLIIYSNSLTVPFIFDDFMSVVDNPDIRDWINVKKHLFSGPEYSKHPEPRPLTFLSFAINYHFFSLNPLGYHLTNIAFHVLTVILIFLFSRWIFSHIFASGLIFPPLMVSLLFASHPVYTEVVTYIHNRSESLAMIFYLVSLYLFAKAFDGTGSRMNFLLSSVTFTLALMAKEIAATLPAILLIFDYIFLSQLRLSAVMKRKYFHLTFWILLIAYILFRKYYFGEVGDLSNITYEKWTPYSYFITQLHVILRYIGLLLIPLPIYQCIDHFIQPAHSFLEPKILIPVLLWLIGIIVGMWWARKKLFRRAIDTTLTTEFKVLLFSVLWFFITLTPTSSFLPINDAMAERRVYLPGFGFALGIISFCLFRLKVDPRTLGSPYSTMDVQNKLKWNHRKILVLFLCSYIFLLAVLTWRRNQIYQHPALLWEDAVSKYPNNFRAHTNLGQVYAEAVEPDKALQSYRKAIELNPNFVVAHYNLGNLYISRKEYDKALMEYQRAVELDPNYVNVYINLGNLYFLSKEYDKAFQFFQNAIRLDPEQFNAHINLGLLYLQMKQHKEALYEFEIALSLSPNDQFLQEQVGQLRKFSTNK